MAGTMEGFMPTMGDIFKQMRKTSQEKKAKNRKYSQQLLQTAQVPHKAHNHGAHLVIESTQGPIDFWPGTGLWIVRATRQRGRGVKKLLAFLEK